MINMDEHQIKIEIAELNYKESELMRMMFDHTSAIDKWFDHITQELIDTLDFVHNLNRHEDIISKVDQTLNTLHKFDSSECYKIPNQDESHDSVTIALHVIDHCKRALNDLQKKRQELVEKLPEKERKRFRRG